MTIFDSHSHYDDSRFDEDRSYILGEYLPNNNVSGVLHASTDLESAEFGVKTASKYDYFYTSVGIHPENMDFPTDWKEKLLALAKNEKVVAIGEVGLDYHYDGYDREAQIALFEEQLIMANELSLPLIVHSRDATLDCMNLLKKHHPRGVMHCFSGSVQTAREVLSLGMYISFTGVLTFKNAKKTIEVLEEVPLDRLLMETDCPYMAPEPFRGKRCDSSMIAKTAEKVAEIKNVSLEDVLKITNENARKLFNIQ